MQNKISIKKILNNTLLKKKLELNTFALILKNTVKLKHYYKQNAFTKISLKMHLLTNFSKKNILHYPLNFYFFTNFSIFQNFIKKNFKYIIMFKIKKKILKKFFFNTFFFSNNQIHFLNYNYLLSAY